MILCKTFISVVLVSVAVHDIHAKESNETISTTVKPEVSSPISSTTSASDQTAAEARRAGSVFSSDSSPDGQDSLLDARSIWEEATQSIFKHRPLGIIRRRKKTKRRHSDHKRRDGPSSESSSVRPQGYPYPFISATISGKPPAVYFTPIHPHQHHQQVLPAPSHNYYDALIHSSQGAQAPYMMAATGAHGAYHMPSHPMLHAGLPHLSSASSPVFVVHMPKPPLAAPYDPLILGGIPQGMIPVHPLQQLIDNLQQQAQVANEHQNTIHLKLKQAKEALSSQLSDHSYDEIENRKDTDTRTRSGRKDDYGKNTHKNVKPDNGNNDAQLVSYNYDDAPSSTSFPLPSRDITPYGHRLDAGEHNNY